MSANGQTTAGKDSGVGIKRCSMFAGSKETPRDLVKSELFAGQTIPAPSDARFWPSSKNILNSIYRAHTATRYICLYCYHQLSYIGIITWPNFAVLHLYSDCVPVTSLPSRRHLRSAESGCLAITGARTTLGSRNVAVAGAKIWNSLPVDLRLLSQSLRTFGHKLKHYLFVDEP